MNIDNLTIGEANQLVKMFGQSNGTGEVVQHGLCIVVLDKGFVYVGELETDGKLMTLRKARNIRRWGTERGLGQLALEGPQDGTALDECGTVKALLAELKHWLVCEVSAWK
jgi:hypothetical protein